MIQQKQGVQKNKTQCDKLNGMINRFHNIATPLAAFS
jgi:hypothetical protein